MGQGFNPLDVGDDVDLFTGCPTSDRVVSTFIAMCGL